MEFDEEIRTERPHAGKHSTDFQTNTDGHNNSIPYHRRQRLDRFRMQNTGEFNGKWRDHSITRRRDNLNTIRTLCSQCSLTKYQTTRALNLWEEYREAFKGYPILESAFAVIVYAANEDAKRWHPLLQPQKECMLKDKAESVDCDLNSIVGAYQDLIWEAGQASEW